MKLKEINGKYYQECEAIMLPTDKIDLNTLCLSKVLKLFKCTKEHLIANVFNTLIEYKTAIPQHLHILSNEIPKEGDWMYDPINKYIQKYNNFYTKKYGWRKIIATTDSSLGLPQPSIQFIEKFIKSYNEGNVITKVLVEYDLNGCCGNILNSCFERNHCHETIKLKVDKSNQITTIRLKDSWNREELEIVLKQYEYYIDTVSLSLRCSKKEWINQNL